MNDGVHDKIEFVGIDNESQLLEYVFESNVDEFNSYYNMDALQDIREELVKMYVIKMGKLVLGYVTVAMGHLKSDTTKEMKEKMINGNIPALLISHLAVHKD